MTVSGDQRFSKAASLAWMLWRTTFEPEGAENSSGLILRPAVLLAVFWRVVWARRSTGPVGLILAEAVFRLRFGIG